MFDASAFRPRSILWIVAGLALCGSFTACNFKDPVSALPSSGCEDGGDCNDNGRCDVEGGVGVCICDDGFEGNTCKDCAPGYESVLGDCVLPSTTNNATNNQTTMTNNTVAECGDGELLVDGECIRDGCAANPCGDGTCTVTGDNVWTCECPNGTLGIECPSCEAGCINGNCNDVDECICDQGWSGNSCNACAPGFEGVDCDRCAANAFGPNCDTCSTINAAEPWWDTAYGTRQGLIVFNPPGATQTVLNGVVVQHELPHSTLVNMGALERGEDLRVVAAPDVEIDRILGFNSAWNRPDTTIWFPTMEDMSPGAYDIFYIYYLNAAPDAVLNDLANITRPDRGWFQANGRPIYAVNERSGGAVSLHLRQKSPTTLEAYFFDQGDNANVSVEIRFINPQTGIEVASQVYTGNTGTSMNPAEMRDEITLTNQALRMDVAVNAGTGSTTESVQVFLGAPAGPSGNDPSMVVSTNTNSLYQTTLSRALNNTGVPNVLACTPETAP